MAKTSIAVAVLSMLVWNTGWADTLEEKLMTAYKQGYADGYQEGYEEGQRGGNAGSVGNVQPIGVTGTFGSRIIIGGSGDQPSTQGVEIGIWNNIHPYGISNWNFLENSTIVTDAVRKKIVEGGMVQFRGFTFDANSIKPGIGTLSFGSDRAEFEQFSVLDEFPEASAAVSWELSDDVILGIQSMKNLGLTEGMVIYDFVSD